MTRPRWIRLGALAWQDAWTAGGRLLLLASGVAVGVAALALVFALAGGVESVVMHRVLGILPGELEVEQKMVDMGPVRMAAGPVLDPPTVARIRALPGVRDVLRRVRIPLPAHLTAQFSGHRFYSDLIVEAVDPAVVAPDVAPGAFAVRPPDQPVPAVLPTAMTEILNVGLTVNTGLPELSDSLLMGRHFELNLGSSSFKWGPTASVRCVVVGVSPRIGMGGPAIPIGYLPTLDRMLHARGGALPPPNASSVIVALNAPPDLPAVSDAVRALGFATPQEKRAARVTEVIHEVARALSLFGILVLAVAGTGIANGMGLMVKDEAGEIGLFRALGASYRDVLLLYLMRAGVVGVLGGLAGIALAVVASGLANALGARLAPGLVAGGEHLAALSAAGAAAALAFGMAASLAAGWWPARQAARIRPAQALRER